MSRWSKRENEAYKIKKKKNTKNKKEKKKERERKEGLEFALPDSIGVRVTGDKLMPRLPYVKRVKGSVCNNGGSLVAIRGRRRKRRRKRQGRKKGRRSTGAVALIYFPCQRESHMKEPNLTRSCRVRWPLISSRIPVRGPVNHPLVARCTVLFVTRI